VSLLSIIAQSLVFQDNINSLNHVNKQLYRTNQYTRLIVYAGLHENVWLC